MGDGGNPAVALTCSPYAEAEIIPFVAKKGEFDLKMSLGWTLVLVVPEIGSLRGRRTIPKGVPWLRSRSVSTDKGLGTA